MTAPDAGDTEGRSGVLRVGVIGGDGRMGGVLRGLLAEDPRRTCARSFERGDGIDAAGIDVFVEFTDAAAVPTLAQTLRALGRPWVSGTTGLGEAGRQALREAAEHIAVLWSPNMSLGVAVLTRLLGEAARLLPPEWEMELFETHHTAKRDAPSGTALALAEGWTGIRTGELRHGRHGATGPRPQGEVGVHALRLPDVVGEHTIRLGGPKEMLELGHRAFDRAAFAQGALAAASWLSQRKAGLYTMSDWAEDRLRSRGSEA
ncbi:MAG: 4-hydroxy-tetrahydrodipicolinate reductase [Candidatus Eisenbacteria bacterium]|uniref:4-hydroxy-tetrahydrodipicolinate reductase n=1 Tax=Eiseniibacteriota bacterium TaxID=2212470 RepID=A0A956RPI6_UNCEI|nr:4-hydroxy-tetrahydrodipicolinate reductase [Candidatus Eisenbacteria bacterium]